jgi:hypothetical protein
MNKMVRESKPAIPPILKEDLLERMLAVREGEGEGFKSFKKELKESLNFNTGCIALAKKMCDDPEFYKFVKDAMVERERSGYKSKTVIGGYSFLISEIFNFQTALLEISEGKSSNYFPLPSRLTGDRLAYGDLKRYAESDPDVKKEMSALDTLYEKYPDELRRRFSSFTLHNVMLDNNTVTFMISLLRNMRERHLYKDEFKFVDIGTGSGEFSDQFLSFIQERFRNYRIVRTNPIELEITHQKDLKVRIHDISKEPLGEKFNVVMIKDVMKFFRDGEPRGVIWENVRQSTEEGGIVLSGGRGVFKVHVMYHGELRKVSPNAFLGRLEKIKGYEKYIENLKDIVERSDYNLLTKQ